MFSIALQIDPPSSDTELDFTLLKFCSDDGAAMGWKLHFELDERHANGTVTPVVKLDIDVNSEDHDKAAATATYGLDENQRAQAVITAQTADSIRTGDATADDVLDQGFQIIPARASGSPV
jgi:hypothetical protein